MVATDLKKLTKTEKSHGKTFVIVRPGIVASYYTPSPLGALAPLIADTIERYMTFVGKGKLISYVAESGDSKPLTDKRIERDLTMLRKLPKSADGFDLEYSSEPGAGVGQHAIIVAAHDADEDFPEQASLVRLEFGEDAIEEFGEKRLIDFITAQARALKAQSANTGFGFKRASGFEDEATAAINAMLPRYLGFDPCYNDASDLMGGHTLSAHWLNMIDRALFERCGGQKALNANAPEAHVDKKGDIIAIRSSRLPPIGDRNRKADDVGTVPGVARFLKPTRVPLDGMGDDEFDVEAWLTRFDDMPNRNWDNG